MTSSSLERQRIRVPLVSLMLLVGLMGCASGPGSANEKRGLAEATALFKRRCEGAGERIHRIVEDVEAILLLKLRDSNDNFGDQFLMNDPYGRDLGGDGYILTFVRGNFDAAWQGKDPPPGAPARLGYNVVESLDASDGKRYRYTGSVKEVEVTSSLLIGGDGRKYKIKKFVLEKTAAAGLPPRYAVTYDDISTREDREHWIAGSSLRVVDLKTNEVIAERIGYMIDLGQGNNSGGRSPWLYAADHACPGFARNPYVKLRPREGASAQLRQTADFVEKVLRPKVAQGVNQ